MFFRGGASLAIRKFVCNAHAKISQTDKCSRQIIFSLDGKIVSSIGNGLCVLIGIKRDDTEKDANYIVRKILNTKIFDGDNGKRWSASVVDKKYEVLCVSQFTLYHVMKGNKLDFHRSMPAQEAEPFYNNILAELRTIYKPELIKDGKFGAMMKVHIENDGPVTLEIESPSRAESSVVNQAE